MRARRRSLTKLRPHGWFFLAFCAMGAPALVLGCANEAQAGKRVKKQVWKDGDGKPVVRGKKYDPRTSLAPVLEAVQPTVVSIRAKGQVKNPFGAMMPIEGVGSGFIISKDGLVVTNNHVVDGNKEFEVELADGRVLTAQVVGQDPQTDVALLKLDDAKNLPVAVLGSSGKVAVGDWVLAVGSPMGLEQTVTRGIVSAKGRGSLGLYRDGYVDFLQTDAAISPGNSGGPLFNLNGEVVGMNTAVSRAGGGLGFAVPVDQIKRVLPPLHKHGKFVRGWLGVSGQDIRPAIGKTPQEGAVIGKVHAGTPAADAGLEEGDRIVAVEGEKVEDFDDLRGRIGNFGPDEKISLEIERAKKTKKVDVVLGTRPKPGELARIGQGGAVPPSSAAKPPGDRLWKGTPKLGVQVDVDGGAVTVRGVQPGSLASRLGLREGDELQKINGQKIDSIEDIKKALEKSDKRIKVMVKRGEGSHTAMLSVG